jgi:hypothetical protein
MNKFRFVYLLVLSVGSFVISYGQITVPNSGFETVKNNMSEKWEPDSTAISKCFADMSVHHSGNTSLEIKNDNKSKSTVYSSAINLEIGKLYKLSGWIKTENAYSDEYAQYPTSVPACIRMESMPFTMHSQTVGATKDWQYIEVLFFATQSKDRVSLNLGYNGAATGKAWFDDIEIKPVDNFSEYLPQEKIKWYRPAFRFEDKGWIYVHIEGSPYNRGFQFGFLTSSEIKTFINKLALSYNKDNPSMAWKSLRSQVDMLFLRKYENEYITEMKGIADGANKAGINVFDRPVDLLDIVSMNSYIDLSYAADGITKTPNQLTGKRFDSPEEQMDMPDRLHKCSGWLANKSATKSGRVIFAQLFMWNGYMGPDWNVIVDVIPDKGNRLVYETFAGGIHSGTDFYINSKGVMIGETTVGQTPFNPDGTPQSNRIRLAAQYSDNIDDAVKYLTEKNNGLYTNDWLMADTKNDEIAILCLGTKVHKLWRSTKNEFYGNQKDWYWSNNNTKALEVRKEYIANSDNAPYDLTFRPWDRDMVFWNFYEKNKGNIDIKCGMDLLNSSPVNRPHACDGKITTSEMAEKLMFFAHYGKVTLREQFVNENNRIPDLPYAIPRLTLGYSTFSPITTLELVKKLPVPAESKTKEIKTDISEVENVYQYPQELLWQNTIFPASDKENWLISATAGYWYVLNGMPKDRLKASKYVLNELSELNCRLAYTEAKEGRLIPIEAKNVYDVSKDFYIPKVRGTYLLHQLRLKLGNEKFSKMMNVIHDEYNSKNITTDNFIKLAEKTTGEKLKEIIDEWIGRDDLPDLNAACKVGKTETGWRVNLSINQSGKPYHLITSAIIKTKESNIWKKVIVDKSKEEFVFDVNQLPQEVILNQGSDFPEKTNNYFTFSNFYDDFSKTVIVYGTTREIEANHTLALRFQKTAADRFTEILLPVKKDCEVSEEILKNNDLILLGGAYDNSLIKSIAENSGLKLGNSFFIWKDKTYSGSNDGLMIVLPNPYNQNKMVTLIISNSALQLYQMCKNFPRIPSWALFKDEQIVDRGYHEFGLKTEIK